MSKHAFVAQVLGPEDAEQWRTVPLFGLKYKASNSGRVIGPTGKILKQRINRRGYPVVEVSLGKSSRETLVHRMVAMAFHGLPSAGQECRHLNGVQTDNRAENLAWGSHSQNSVDQVAHGTHRNVRKTHCDRGHEFTPENTYSRGPGRRTCLLCKRIMENRGYHRRRALKLAQ
jgi:hypothetical protein